MGTNKIGKISKNHRTLFLLALLVFFLSFCVCEVNAYTDGGTYWGCSNCSDCEAALQDNGYSEVRLTANINNHAGTCIDNPANFSNKTFDCQGHTIDGDDSGSDYGIYLYGKSGNIIKNCVITDFYDGIFLNSSSTTP